MTDAASTERPAIAAGSRPVSLRQALRAWLLCVTTLWATTALAAAASTSTVVAHAARSLLELKLTATVNPPPSPARVIALALHNVRASAWPLLLPLAGAPAHPWSRALGDLAIALTLAVNGALVGGALGVYGTRLLPYIPQLPLEWAGIALGPTGWVLARNGRMPNPQLVLLVALLALLLCGAALIETFAVPHR